MTGQALTHFLKFEQKLKYFEGYLSTVELTYKDDGSLYCKTSIPLKQNKDDEPLWLNCRIFDAKLVEEFGEKCKKGSRVGVWGFLKETEDRDGKNYINFYIKSFTLLKEPTEKV